MGGKKKLSSEEFAEQFAKIVIPRLAKMSPEERESRIEAFEKTASKVASDCRATTSGTSQTHYHPLAARGRE